MHLSAVFLRVSARYINIVTDCTALIRRHHCPHPTKPKSDIMTRTEPVHKMGSTEYKAVFFTHEETRPRDSFKPAQKALTREMPMVCDTTHKVDFVKHLVHPPVPRPPVVFKKTEGTIEGESEYKKEFRPKTSEPAKPILPVLNRIRSTSEPFQTVTTQMTDFIPQKIPPREYYGERRIYEPPKEVFNGCSTLKDDYRGLPLVEPTKSMKPSQNAKVSHDKFDGTTCHKENYRPFNLPERFIKPKQVHCPPTEPFEGVSTFVAEFPVHKDIKPTASYKPPVIAKRSEGQFDSVTISRQSYRKWDLPPRFSRPPTIYEPPKEKFEGNSLFTTDFIHPGPPEQTTNYKPKAEAIKHEVPMDSDTINRLDYKTWDVTQRQELIKQEKPYEPPVEKFQGRSTTSESYRGEYAPPAPSNKPKLKPYTKGEPFNGLSTYKDCFSKGGFKPDFITGNPNKPMIPGYVFSHEDTRTGHKFYVPVVETTQQLVQVDDKLSE